ncbi:hypothetical protein MHYP_G00347890 [Metynnis hypsauchen]
MCFAAVVDSWLRSNVDFLGVYRTASFLTDVWLYLCDLFHPLTDSGPTPFLANPPHQAPISDGFFSHSFHPDRCFCFFRIVIFLFSSTAPSLSLSFSFLLCAGGVITFLSWFFFQCEVV